MATLPSYIPIPAGGEAEQDLHLRGLVADLMVEGGLGSLGTLRIFYHHASGTGYMTLAAVRLIEWRLICRHFSPPKPDVDQRPLADLEP